MQLFRNVAILQGISELDIKVQRLKSITQRSTVANPHGI